MMNQPELRDRWGDLSPEAKKSVPEGSRVEFAGFAYVEELHGGRWFLCDKRGSFGVREEEPHEDAVFIRIGPDRFEIPPAAEASLRRLRQERMSKLRLGYYFVRNEENEIIILAVRREGRPGLHRVTSVMRGWTGTLDLNRNEIRWIRARQVPHPVTILRRLTAEEERMTSAEALASIRHELDAAAKAP